MYSVSWPPVSIPPLTLAACLAFIAAATGASGAQSTASPERAKPEVRASPGFRQPPWHFDLDVARAAAKAADKLILACFTRSDGSCAECDALAHGLLADDRFAAFASDVVLFVHQTPGDAKSEVDELTATKGFARVPALVFLDADGNVQARLEVETCTIDTLARAHEATRACVDLAQMLRSMPAERAATHAGELLAAEVALRKWTFAELEQRLQRLGTQLGADQRARMAPFVDELEWDWLAEQTEMPARERALRFKKLFRDKRFPRHARATRGWIAFAEAGSAAEDPVMVDTAVEMLTSTRDVPAGLLDRLRQRAEELRRR